jgi:predicted transcriptional regulator
MKLKKLPASNGLIQEVLAKKAGISRPCLARLEMGRHDTTRT